MAKDICSLECEQEVISGLITHNEYFFSNQNSTFLTEDDFATDAHQTIVSVIFSLIRQNERADKLTVSTRVKELGISLEISVFEYLRGLSVRLVSESSFNASVKELKRLWVRRKIRKDFQDGARAMEDAKLLNFDQVVAVANKYAFNLTNLDSTNNQPQDLFDNVKEEVEALGNNPEEAGLQGPYEKFQKWFGGFTKGDIYVFCALYGVGKSTIIDDIILKVCTQCNPEKNVRGLILDTELETSRVKMRKVGSLAGVSPYFIRTGKWRLNAEMVGKVRGIWDTIEKYKGKIDHIYVGNKSTDEICAITRRWAAKQRAENPNVELIVALDYLKMAEKVDDSNKEYQIIGGKVDTYKQLATELQLPFITGLQLNRQNDLSLSQRVGWFSSYVFKLRYKTDEERALFPDSGNCILERDKSREWGEEGHEINRLVSYINMKKETVVVKNFLNYDIKNFDVREIGTAEEMVKMKLKPEKSEDDGELL